jgi:hypothetical protein
MGNKAKGIIKFIIACGIVVSAAIAVYSILYRMRAKLRDPEDSDEELDEDGELCNGSCESCGMCGDTDIEDDAEDDDINE